MTQKDFSSDNASGVSARIVDAIVRQRSSHALAYGQDTDTRSLEQRFSELFETEVRVFCVPTGTAANALSMSVLCPPWGAIFCHEEAHLYVDECGAPEMYTSGAKLVPLGGEHGRVALRSLTEALGTLRSGDVHQVQAKVLSVTQATECGTLYDLEQLRALTRAAKSKALSIHMDGARFANAVSALGMSPAELTWKSGIDVLSFGATKNGAIGAEAVVFFDKEHIRDFELRRKRAGHLVSKMRFLSAQLLAYVEDGAWLEDASRANAAAHRLATGLERIEGVRLHHPQQINQVFVELPEAKGAALKNEGFEFLPWGKIGSGLYRFVTSFDTTEEDVDALLSAAERS